MENQRRTIMWLIAAIILVVGLDAYLFAAEVFKNQ
jgi:hypothetical protein